MDLIEWYQETDTSNKSEDEVMEMYADFRVNEKLQEAVECYVPDGNPEVFKDKIKALITQ